jgi:hypothetical protein
MQAILGRSSIIHGCEPLVRRQERRLSAASGPPQVGHLWKNTGGYASNIVYRVEVTVYPISTPRATEA